MAAKTSSMAETIPRGAITSTGFFQKARRWLALMLQTVKYMKVLLFHMHHMKAKLFFQVRARTTEKMKVAEKRSREFLPPRERISFFLLKVEINTTHSSYEHHRECEEQKICSCRICCQ